MRDARAEIPPVYVVTPSGSVKEIRPMEGRGTCLRRPVMRRPDGTTVRGPWRVAEAYADEGWMLLADAYAMDTRPEVREHGLSNYIEHQRAMRQKRPGTRERKLRGQQEDGAPPTGKDWRDFPVKFPEEWLPEKVIARRENRDDVSAAPYSLPPAPKGGKGGKAPRPGA